MLRERKRLAENENVANIEVSTPLGSLSKCNLDDHCTVLDSLSPPHVTVTASALGEEGSRGERHGP